MKIDGVFSGGGVKAYAFIGALERVYDHNHTFERVAGSSAGAIIAAFLASGYQFREMDEMIQELDTKKLMDAPKWTTFIPFSKWVNLYFQLGLYKGNKLEKWIHKQLARKKIHTFNDLKPGYLKVIVSDISLGKLVVIPDDLHRIYGINPDYFPVAKAVRMSAGFPYFFMPKNIPTKANGKRSLIVDGGLLSNFPLWVFNAGNNRSKRPVVGMKLNGHPAREKPREIKNAIDMFQALFSTMLNAHDARYVSTSEKENIIFLPVDHVETTDFELNPTARERLIRTGKDQAQEFLKYWPN
ncbi:MAG TPA: patatin-like phospholipase family protein [Lentibacillus sp.]|uniref:patatin-like phospholipase family protein n=1 Tax=Lentibacillus sp. TaxID=1925746 RepID=UPI002B4AE9A7|nr:patatin-like phospholipase family protein [Lentibacillus sp.]HLR62428.1 patatin-like phospholipase family protein [Lentibacillus sp.]